MSFKTVCLPGSPIAGSLLQGMWEKSRTGLNTVYVALRVYTLRCSPGECQIGRELGPCGPWEALLQCVYVHYADVVASVWVSQSQALSCCFKKLAGRGDIL